MFSTLNLPWEIYAGVKSVTTSPILPYFCKEHHCKDLLHWVNSNRHHHHHYNSVYLNVPWARSDMIYWNPAVQIRVCDHQLELERDRTCIQQTSSLISHGSVRSSSRDTVSTEHFGENVVEAIPTVFYHNMWSSPSIKREIVSDDRRTQRGARGDAIKLRVKRERTNIWARAHTSVIQRYY